MPEPENILIFIADALRYDHHPDFPGSTYKTIVAGPNSPAGIPALVSGLSQEQHGITWFFDDPIDSPTVFDLRKEGYDVSYFDHPADRMRDLLRNPPLKPLSDLEPPFVFVERGVETHTPYGRTWRELEDPEDVDVRPDPGGQRTYPEGYTGENWDGGNDYIQLMRSGDVPYKEDYEKGVEMAKKRFLDLVGQLKDRGIFEDTMCIFTADHGECFGGAEGSDDSCNNFIHNQPCPHVSTVGTTFYDRDVSIDSDLLKQVDILSHWDERWKGGRSDLEMIKESRDLDPEEEKAVRERLEALGYEG